MAFLNREIADALCTVITLGFAVQKQANGDMLVFEYEKDGEAASHLLIRDAFRNFGVAIDVRKSAPQNVMPYILGHRLSQQNLDTFIIGLTEWSDNINNMFIAANDQPTAMGGPPRGAYIGVQFFVDPEGNILNSATAGFDAEPLVYGPSALSLHDLVYRDPTDDREISIIESSYETAKVNTNTAARSVEAGLGLTIGGDFDAPYETGKIFGSSHGMIRAMVNSVTPPPNIQSVFAEIALGANTTKVSSCIPCAIFMQSFGYPASSIHLGRGDNWRIPDFPSEKILSDWRNAIISCYLSGVELCNPRIDSYDNTRLDDMVAMLIAERNDEQDITPYIPDVFLEALTFEGSFIDRINRTPYAQ